MPETVRDMAPAPALSPPALKGEWTAGAVLLRGGPFAGLAVAVVTVAGALLVPAGLWRPEIALPLVLVGLALVWRVCLLIPVRPVPVWTTVLGLLAAGGEGIWAAVTHAEHLVLRRDSGSYALYAQWIATRHGLPVHGQLDAFGGSAALAIPGFTLQSPAYFQVVHGGSADVVPQFLVGAPSFFSLGWWAGGWEGLLLMPALAGAGAVFAVAALAARLIGPRWAPLAAGSLAVAFPMLLTSRSTYSEPVALVIIATAASLIADATLADRHRWALGLAGALVLGAGVLVRIDVLTEVALLVPVTAVLALRRHAAAGGIAVGLLVGAVGAVATDLLTSKPYLSTITGSLIPLLDATVVLALLSVVAVLIGRRYPLRTGSAGAGSVGAGSVGAGSVGAGSAGAGSVGAGSAGAGLAGAGSAGAGSVGAGSAGPDPDPAPVGSPPMDSAPVGSPPVDAGAAGRGAWRRMQPVERAGTVFVLLVGVLLASRPLWQTVRSLEGAGAVFVAGLQRGQGLSVDGSRTYAEWSLAWVAWWLGPFLVIAAWIGLAVASGRALRWALSPRTGPGARPPAWVAPLAVGLGSSVLTLWRPGITPDHPWADRRLVPVLLPTFVIAGTAGVAWAVRRARRRLSATLFLTVAIGGVVTSLVQPLVATAPLAWLRTEQGEAGVIRTVCAALEPGDAVVAVDNRGFNEWPQVVRGVCGHPAATLQNNGVALPTRQLRESVTRLGELVAGRGGRLVLLGSGEAPDQMLTRLGLTPQQVVHVYTTEDRRRLAVPPLGVSRLGITVWLAPWTPTGP